MQTSSVKSSVSDRGTEIDIFLRDTAQLKNARREKLAGDASFRRYERIHYEQTTAVLMDAPPAHEDVRPFIKVAEYLAGLGFSAPRIIARDETKGFLLLEDLGDDSYTAVLAGRSPLSVGVKEKEMYEAAMLLLADFHSHTAKPAISLKPYDEKAYLTEISLFSDWYLPAVAGKEKAIALREEYLALWSGILRGLEGAEKQFVHRDFHADNLMWLPERKGTARVGMLDFQDALCGPAAYDVVSLLEDARRDVEPSTTQHALDIYIHQTKVNKEQFMRQYALLGAQRNSKIIGIFTRLAVRDNKHQYLNFLPRVWGHLQHDVEHPALAPLKQWLQRHVVAEWRGILQLPKQGG